MDENEINPIESKQELSDALSDTVTLLATCLETLSPALGSHSKRVGEISGIIAGSLGLDELIVRDVKYAGVLHDLGKIATIMDTNEYKTAPVYSTFPSFPLAGHNLMGVVKGFDRVQLYIKHQLEQWDGGGKPDGLCRDKIPIGSRIIAVANAYDEAVFSKHGVTQPRRSKGKAVLKEGSRDLFDSDVVGVLLDHADEVDHEVFDDQDVEISALQLEEGMILSRNLYNAEDELLLAKETEMKEKHINALFDIAHGHLVAGGIFVKCKAEK